MLATILKVAAVIGSLVIAGISAYAAYKQTVNKGSHTLVTNTGCDYGYGYGYYRQPKRISRTGNTERDVDTVTESVNDLYNQTDAIKMALAKILQRLEALEQRRLNRQQVIVQQTPMGPQPTIIDVDPTDSIDVDVKAIEAAEDNAVMKISQGINPSTNQPLATTNYGTHNFATSPMSDLGRAALNYQYNFNMNRGFDQFYNSDMHRRLVESRNDMYSNPNVRYPDPYSTLPPTVQRLCGMIPPTPCLPGPMMNNDMPTFEKPIDECPGGNFYGHYGAPMPSTRQSIPYGCI
jgi:hypothetical protein